MKVHEYQAKELLAKYGANVPRHIVVRSADEAEKAFDELSGGGGVVLKAQVHAGGRGAGQLLGYAEKLGGVKFVPTKAKVRPIAEAMLKHALKTKQTGPEGQPIRTMIVQADAEPVKEFYVAMILDRVTRPAESSWPAPKAAWTLKRLPRQTRPRRSSRCQVSPEDRLLRGVAGPEAWPSTSASAPTRSARRGEEPDGPLEVSTSTRTPPSPRSTRWPSRRRATWSCWTRRSTSTTTPSSATRTSRPLRDLGRGEPRTRSAPARRT